MFTLLQGSITRAELEEKRSKFIATLAHVQSEEEARQFLRAVRAEFPDARHNCFAYIVESQDGPPRTHSSDDGEPSGTAGPPILEILSGAQLVNVAAVVTRYFGGILLGTGGLVRAYSEATTRALEEASFAERVKLQLVQFQVPAEFAGRFLSEIHQRQLQIVQESWGKDLIIQLAIADRAVDEVSQLLATLTHLPADPSLLGVTSVDIPLSA